VKPTPRKEQNVSRNRKLALITAALLALVFAGVGGAVVKYTIFRVNRGQWAALSGTNIDCRNELSLGPNIVPGFNCILYGARPGSGPVGRTYELFVTVPAIVIERLTPSGKGRTIVRSYNNP
jgi:hypothetical protein